MLLVSYYIFFLYDTATTEIYTYGHTLSLHDALPIFAALSGVVVAARRYHRAGAPEDAVDGCCCRIAPRGIVVDAGSLAQHLPRGATGRHAEPVGAVVPWRALPRKYVPVGSVRRLLGAMPHNAQVRRARVCDRIVDRIGQRARPRALPYQLGRSEEDKSEL